MDKSLREILIRIENRLQSIETRLDSMENTLHAKVFKSCEKMSEHIDFIENVYDNVQQPLSYIVNKVNRVLGYQNSDLPSLTNDGSTVNSESNEKDDDESFCVELE